MLFSVSSHPNAPSSRPCAIRPFLAILLCPFHVSVLFTCGRFVVDDAPLDEGDALLKKTPFENRSTSRSRTHTRTSTGLRIPYPLFRFLSLPSIRDARGSVAAARASDGRVGCDGCGQRCGGARGRHGQASGRLRTATVRKINNKEEGNDASAGGEGGRCAWMCCVCLSRRCATQFHSLPVPARCALCLHCRWVESAARALEFLRSRNREALAFKRRVAGALMLAGGAALLLRQYRASRARAAKAAALAAKAKAAAAAGGPLMSPSPEDAAGSSDESLGDRLMHPPETEGLIPVPTKSKGERSASVSGEQPGDAKAAATKRVAVDALFFRRLLRILRIAVPGALSTESAYLTVLTALLFARTFFSIYIAELIGNNAQSMVSRRWGRMCQPNSDTASSGS